MQLYEPATFLTDVLLAVFAGWLAWRLYSRSGPDDRATRWWGHTLALTAASALIGGGYHGFAPNLSAGLDATWWRLTLLTINLMSAAMATSWMYEIVAAKRHATMQVVIIVKLVAFAAAAMIRPEFVVAIADYGSTLLAWLAAAVALRRSWSGWMLAGIGLSAIAATVQQLHWDPAAWFNHNDLYHGVQALALWAFFRAACGLDRTARAGR